MVWYERGNWEHYGRGKVAVAKARPSCVVGGVAPERRLVKKMKLGLVEAAAG